MSLMENVEAATTGALNATTAETDDVKSAVASAAATSAAAAIQPPPPQAVALLWYLLVGGLVAAMLASLIGIVWAVVDGNDKTSPDVVVTVFSSSLAALIGLFVKSPTT